MLINVIPVRKLSEPQNSDAVITAGLVLASRFPKGCIVSDVFTGELVRCNAALQQDAFDTHDAAADATEDDRVWAYVFAVDGVMVFTPEDFQRNGLWIDVAADFTTITTLRYRKVPA